LPTHPLLATYQGGGASAYHPKMLLVFSSMVLFLLKHQYTDLKEYFVDGTKLRADANRHKVVWAKNTKRY
jgi:transposase